MRPHPHALHRSAETLVPVLIHTSQLLEAGVNSTLDDLLRPAPRLLRAHNFFGVQAARIDWTAVAAATYVYFMAFLVWLYLAR